MSQQYSKGYCTDTLMRKVWGDLVSDFRSTCGETFGIRHQRLLLAGDVEGYRKEPWPTKSRAPAAVFKRQYQLENLFKRYRFTKDAFTTADLDKLTTEKFVATQCRVNMCKPQSQVAHAVLQRARCIAKMILGRYDLEEHMSLCRFGKKASVGSSKSRSYLDLKLMENPITGSLAHIRWMTENYLPTDRILSDVLGSRPQGFTYTVCNTLTNTNVPKSWTSLRSIMPNTLLGGFYTHGIGKLIQKRLAEWHLDLKHLQKVHKILAQQSSISRKLVTADLSAASDSIVSWLLNCILPRDWYTAIKLGRIDHTLLKKGEDSSFMCSYMGMGIGFTFTIQTLVFYCLIKAIGELLGVAGTYSVYGDDLIYPRKIHRYVKSIFPSLNFILNKDKTFAEDNFRESCGGDYYHGVDVRPFQPEGQGRVVNRLTYLALLYKTINGLSKRWTEKDIGITLHSLRKEVLRVNGSIFQVPFDYPDYSGVQVLNPNQEWYMGYDPVVYTDSWCCFSFKYLDMKSQRRPVVHQHSYYWDVMRSSSVLKVSPKPCLPEHMTIDKYLSWYKTLVDEAPEERFGWVKQIPKKFVRSNISGARLRRLTATVPEMDSIRLTTSVGATSLWTKGVI